MTETKPTNGHLTRNLTDKRRTKNRGGWTRAELHHGLILQYASVYTISHVVRTSGQPTEDPLKSEFLPPFWCKC